MSSISRNLVSWEQLETWRKRFRRRNEGEDKVFELFFDISQLMDFLKLYQGGNPPELFKSTSSPGPFSLGWYLMHFVDSQNPESPKYVRDLEMKYLKLIMGLKPLGLYLNLTYAQDIEDPDSTRFALAENISKSDFTDFCSELNKLYTSTAAYPGISSVDSFFVKLNEIKEIEFEYNSMAHEPIKEWMESLMGDLLNKPMLQNFDVETVIISAGGSDRKTLKDFQAFNHPDRCKPKCPQG